MYDLGPGMSYSFTPEWHAQIRKDRSEKQRCKAEAISQATTKGHVLGMWQSVGLHHAWAQCVHCDAEVTIGVGRLDLLGLVIEAGVHWEENRL